MLDKSIQQNQSFSFQIQHEATAIDPTLKWCFLNIQCKWMYSAIKFFHFNNCYFNLQEEIWNFDVPSIIESKCWQGHFLISKIHWHYLMMLKHLFTHCQYWQLAHLHKKKKNNHTHCLGHSVQVSLQDLPLWPLVKVKGQRCCAPEPQMSGGHGICHHSDVV